jgi:hypothetical protein
MLLGRIVILAVEIATSQPVLIFALENRSVEAASSVSRMFEPKSPRIFHGFFRSQD